MAWKGKTRQGGARIVERRINYVLKSGANWAGADQGLSSRGRQRPARSYRQLLRSGIQKISATQFELRGHRFYPDAGSSHPDPRPEIAEEAGRRFLQIVYFQIERLDAAADGLSGFRGFVGDARKT
jgi:hypothetical protein